MNRRALPLAAALGLLATSLLYPPTPVQTVSSCEECYDSCNQIPMETQECLQMYCPECADSGSLTVR
jgi:hypothetical protein